MALPAFTLTDLDARPLLAVGLCLLLVPPLAAADRLATGSLEVTVLRAAGDPRPRPAESAVVWLVGSPAEPRAPLDPRSRRSYAIGMRDKRFTPRVLAVPVGASVTFPNHDRIYHNAFSLSEIRRFDLGLYRNGKSEAVRFDRAGVVRVYCNIHPQMAALVIVVDGERHALCDSDGRARLERVPVGEWALRIWDERGGEWRGEVLIEPDRTATQSVLLDAAGYREERFHLNKEGRRYPPPEGEDSRY